MDFAFSPEQEELRGFAREFLASRYDDARLASLADSPSGADEEVWEKLASMGWLDAELTFLDQAVLYEETGYRLLPAPYLSTTALAMPALDAEAAVRVGKGTLKATLAWAEPARPQALLDPVSASFSAGRLTGEKVLVPDGASADVFVVVASDGLYAVDASAAEVTPRETLDGTRRVASVTFRGAPARLLASGDEARAVLGGVRDRAYAALALEAVGVAQRALDLLVEYARTREQFGRPIGVYQAVSHRASNVYVRLQEARSLAYWAAWCVSEGDELARQACLAAKALAGETAVFACENAIQGHGGIGFTWEHVLHRYYKRAQWLAAFDGPPRSQRAEVAALLLD
jgi:alkylation response protein AidB-like acyl-CoA dehydrogenase